MKQGEDYFAVVGAGSSNSTEGLTEPREGSMYKESRRRRYFDFSKTQWVTIVILLINILILYVLHTTHSHDNQYGSKSYSISMEAPPSMNGMGDNDLVVVLSRNSNGDATVGAGVSVEYNTLGDDKPNTIKHLKVIKSTSGNVICAYQKDGIDTVITTLDVETTNGYSSTSSSFAEPKSSNNTLTGFAPQDLIQLSTNVSILLANSFNGEYPTVAVPIIANENNDKNVAVPPITTLKDSATIVANRSITSRAGKIGPETIAFVSYAYEATQRPWNDSTDWTRNRTAQLSIGVYNSVSRKMDLSTTNTLSIGPDSSLVSSTHFTAPVSVSSLPEQNLFAVSWYSEPTNFDDGAKYDLSVTSGLCIDIFASSAQNLLERRQSRCTKKHQPAYHMDVFAVQGTEPMILAVYYDRANNYALTISSIFMASHDSTAHFRSSVVVDDAASGFYNFGSGYGWFPTPVVKAFGSLTESKVAVTFLHPGNNGRAYTQVFNVENGVMEPIFHSSIPVMPTDSYTIASENSDGSDVLQLATVPLTDDSLLIAYVGNDGEIPVKQVSILHILNAPMGIATKTDKVTISGVVPIEKDLIPGKVYYATATGYLVSASDDKEMHNNHQLISINANLSVSLSSQVGIAMTTNTLLLTPPSTSK